MNLGEVKVVYDAADFRALYRACGNCKRNALIGLVAVPALFTLLAIGNGMRGIDLLFEAIPYVLIMITVYTAAYFLLPLNAVRLRKRSGWTEPMAVLLANEGIATHHPNQKSLFYWSKIQKVLVSGNRLFLFTTPNCAIILPRHCFSDDAQFENWSERAAERWRAARTDAAG